MSDPDPIVARFEALKARFPDKETPRWTLATHYERQKRYDDAIAELEELVALKPDYCVAYLRLGACLIEKERFEAAKEALDRCVALAREQGHEQPRIQAELLLDEVAAELE